MLLEPALEPAMVLVLLELGLELMLEPALEPGDFADSFMPGAASRSEAHLATQAAE